jgi:hypothetical protein
MTDFPDERHIQALGKAIIVLALRADKCKTVELGLEWIIQAIL